MQERLGAAKPGAGCEPVKTLILIVNFYDTLSTLAKLGHFRGDWKTGNATGYSQAVCLVIN